MKIKTVSVEFARQWHAIGQKYQGAPSRRSAINAAINDGHEIDCWEKAAAFGAGAAGYEFKIETYQRYGLPNVGQDGYAERSMNHANNEPEAGVSVVTEEWARSMVGWVSIQEYSADKTPLINVTGLVVGHGSDGEKLLLPCGEQEF